MSPTYESIGPFDSDFSALSRRQRELFLIAVKKFRADLTAGQFRKGLRGKRVQGSLGIFEMTFAPDGRATWQFGDEVIGGEPHIIWRRIGTHDIFSRP
ncbi:MAG TPA: hypothetical protein VFC57_05505 [Aeromicrobium sp.]|nr:hypothetical protein [Aeromicrobium sp.]